MHLFFIIQQLSAKYSFFYIPGAFLIPYLSFLVIGALPLFFLEYAISQFSSSTALSVWNICPLFKGSTIICSPAHKIDHKKINIQKRTLLVEIGYAIQIRWYTWKLTPLRIFAINCQLTLEKTEGQSTMDNPETQTILGTRHRSKKQSTQCNTEN